MKKFAAILLLFALLLAMTACAGIDEPHTETETPTTAAPATQEPQTTTLPPTTEAPQPQTEPAPTEETEHEIYVYSIFSDNAEVDDVLCCFDIPSVWIDEEEVEDANALIWKELHDETYVPLVEEPMAEYGNIDIAGISYDYNYSHGILSVIAWYHGFYTSEQTYRVYNILASEKRLATRAEVLQAFGMTEEDYRVKAADIVGSYAWDSHQSALINASDRPDFAEEIYDCIRKTVVEDNLFDTMPFVMDTGTLFILARIYTPAGAGYYDALIPMDYTVNSEYLAFISAGN